LRAFREADPIGDPNSGKATQNPKKLVGGAVTCVRGWRTHLQTSPGRRVAQRGKSKEGQRTSEGDCSIERLAPGLAVETLKRSFAADRSSKGLSRTAAWGGGRQSA
jgi:hypothetical protein